MSVKPVVRLLFVSMFAALAVFGSSNAAGAITVAPPSPGAGLGAPTVRPSGGEVVGIAAPITLTFDRPVVDRVGAELAVKIEAATPMTGKFTWIDGRQLRWTPNVYWKAHTSVRVQAGYTMADFEVGDATYSVANVSSHQFTVSVDGTIVQQWPASMGKPGHETPWGQFSVLEKYRNIIMDSSTYGVPIDSPEGYRLNVEYATRIVGGIFVHAAPWSLDSQGYANVSHGCINLSTEHAAWFYNNARYGDPVVVTG